MPVTNTIDWSSASGVVGTGVASTFSAARDATNGSFVTVAADSAFGVSTTTVRTALGHQVGRMFLAFDTSGIPNNIITARLGIHGIGNNNPGCQTIVVKADKPSLTTPIATTDYRAAIVGFATGSSMAGNVTDYSSVYTPWLTTGYNVITLNAAARADIGNPDSTVFQVAVLNYGNDYLNVAPGTTGERRNSFTIENPPGNKLKPFLEITYGLGSNVDDVSYLIIDDINGVRSLNTYQVNGINP